MAADNKIMQPVVKTTRVEWPLSGNGRLEAEPAAAVWPAKEIHDTCATLPRVVAIFYSHKT